MAMESFMDTPLVNGTVYPYMEVEPKAYRLRILNACNDRFVNLQLYKADPAIPTADGAALNTEVRMVPAVVGSGFPEGWPTDGREGGVPDPTMVGPSFIQIGTEGGFLPAPVLIHNQPVGWNLNPTTFNFGNVVDYALLLGPAERADVLVDFSDFEGQTLILYNDAPAAFPALDTRYDYYTGNPDQTGGGGAPSTLAGYGPNTRTIMQIRVTKPLSTPFQVSLPTLESVFAKLGTKRGVFEASQEPIIIPTDAYNTAYEGSFSADPYARIFEQSKTFQTLAGDTLNIPFQPKAIQDEMGEAFDVEYGRMSGFLGVQLPAQVGQQRFTLFPYASPPIEILEDSFTPLSPVAGDGTQIWKITHNGVDTHTIHFHLMNVQLLNRVAWDNAVSVPDANELGWKETVRVNPLEDTIVAMRPYAPTLPFDVPNSYRPLDVTKPIGATLMGGPGGYKDPLGNPVTIVNHLVNWGWEYVLHCHLLGHEEMDMMHGMSFAVAPRAPSALTGIRTPDGTSVDLAWTDNSANETGFTVQRAADANFTVQMTEVSLGVNVTAFTLTGLDPTSTYFLRVIASNVVGDNDTPGFPIVSAESAPTNVIQIGGIVAQGHDDLLATWDGQGVFYRDSLSGVLVGLSSAADFISCGDLDGDGRDDLLGVWASQDGVWTMASSSGEWTRLAMTAQDIAAGDISGDGRVDLIGTWNGQGTYYRDTMTGDWVLIASQAEKVASGDIDGDGTDDLVGLWAAQGGVWVKYSGTGQWEQLA
jgi:FtsP/CotA-like multicopper oxidase with cupredoxin domain